MAEEPAATDWAYAAGFLDGEGCIAIIRSFMPARGLFQYGVSVVVVLNGARSKSICTGYNGS